MKDERKKQALKNIVKLRRNAERISPTIWLFVIGIFLFLIGLIIPGLDFLAFVGGFIFLFYIVLWIIWAIMNASQ